MRPCGFSSVLLLFLLAFSSTSAEAAIGIGARSGLSGKVLSPTSDLENTHDTGYALGFTAQGNLLFGALALRSDAYWGRFGGKEISSAQGPVELDDLSFGTAAIGPFWRFTTLDVGVLAEYTWGDRSEWAAKPFANLNLRKLGIFAELRVGGDITWFGGGLTWYLFGF